ncbi:MAG: hypothetical protein ACO1OB_25080 [Archangium sp.]
MRCEVHGGFRHDETPAGSQDVHTDDHGDLKFLQHATMPSLFALPTVVESTWCDVDVHRSRITVQKKVWALAPKGSPPRV